MGSLLYALGIYLIFFGLLYVNYGSFTVSVVKWKQRIKRSKSTGKIKVNDLPMGKKLGCYIPFTQPAKVCKALYGKGAMSTVYAIVCYVDTVLIIVPLIIKFFIPISETVMLVATFALYAGIIIHALSYGIITAICARLYDYNWVYTIIVFLLPHIACFYMKNNIAVKMHDMYEEKRFDENKGDTVIKRKLNK